MLKHIPALRDQTAAHPAVWTDLILVYQGSKEMLDNVLKKSNYFNVLETWVNLINNWLHWFIKVYMQYKILIKQTCCCAVTRYFYGSITAVKNLHCKDVTLTTKTLHMKNILCFQ